MFMQALELHEELMELDTFGTCQRPVFSLVVSQLMLNINRSLKLQKNNESKNTPNAQNV